MFTKCPSCHTEISFEPPANAPAGYKHRIKCPNPACGVTISVALPSKQTAPAAATAAQVGMPGFAPEAAGTASAALEATRSSGKVKYKGRARSCFMLILSLIFVALNVLSYLIAAGKFAGIPAIGFVPGTYVLFNGLDLIMRAVNDFNGTLALFGGQYMMYNLILYALPTALFLFASILAFCDLIGFFAGKYGKTGNIIFSLFVFLFAAAILMSGYILAVVNGVSVEFGAYFQQILANQLIAIIVAGAALVYFIFAIIFAAKKKKTKEPKIR